MGRNEQRPGEFVIDRRPGFGPGQLTATVLALTSGPDVALLLRKTVEAIHDHLDPQLVEIWTLPPDREHIVRCAHAGYEWSEEMGAQGVAVTPEEVAEMALGRSSVLTGRMGHDRSTSCGLGAEIPKMTVEIPLVDEGRAAGVLFAAFREVIDLHAMHALEAIADFLALALRVNRQAQN